MYITKSDTIYILYTILKYTIIEIPERSYIHFILNITFIRFHDEIWSNNMTNILFFSVFVNYNATCSNVYNDFESPRSLRK